MNALETFFGSASWRDILISCVDIFIVYYVIYRVLLTIKGTRAAQMVIGLVLIGAGFFAAERFEMTTFSWLLDNFINYFIIIIIVVFQQDIRRGLVRIGQGVFPFGRQREVTHALDELINAAERLAKARIGGIFVFERDADLTDFLEHGQPIDAKLSRELLTALFVPSRDNELHDGAVVIDKGFRISMAGAVLPLSGQSLAQEFGTRHRAAIGITEETDAVSVVVSEERGEISLCMAGNIARDLEPAELRRALMGLFYGEEQAQRIAEEAQAAAQVARALAALSERERDGDAPAEREPSEPVPAPAPRATSQRAASSPPRPSGNPIEEPSG